MHIDTVLCLLLAGGLLNGTWGAAGELNLLDSDLDGDANIRHTWSPGTLKYYGRAELQASDHR